MDKDHINDELPKSYYRLFLKVIPLAFNYCIDMLPYTYGLILFRIINEPISQAVLTLGLSYNNFSFNHLYGVQNSIQIRGSKDLGRKNYIEYWNNFFSILIIGSMLMSIGITSVIFSFNVLTFLRFPSYLIPLISNFIKKICLGVVLQQINGILKSFLITQKIIDVFVNINILNISIFLIFETFGILYFRLGLNGFIIGFYAKQICEFLFLIHIIYTKNQIKFPNLWQIQFLKNLKKDFKFVFCVIIGLYGELFTEEVSTYFTALSNNLQFINSWQFFLSIANYQYCLQLGFASILRTYCGYCVGEMNETKFYKYLKTIVACGSICNFTFSFIVAIFCDQIASIYTKDPETKQFTQNLYRINLILMPLDFLFICGTQILPVIKQEKITFLFGIFFYPLLTLGFDYIYFFQFRWGVEALGLGWTTAEIILFSLIWIIFFSKVKKFWHEINTDKEVRMQLLKV